MNRVLVLTYGEDLHADYVTDYFSKNGYGFLRIDTENLIGNYNISFSTEKSCCIINTGDKDYIIDSSWNIWNRRVMNPDVEKGLPKDILNMIFEETERTWDGLLFSHKGRVVNRPQNHFFANNKIDQLNFAVNNSENIYVPDTIVSNNPTVVKNFYEKHKGNVCFKLQKGVIIKSDEQYQTIYTNRVTKSDLEKIDLVATHPCLFQEYIEKNYEIRIIATEFDQVGIAIHSQKSEVSKIDFRKYDFDNVTYNHIELPNEIKQFCLKMIKHYGLHFGVFDFIFSINKEFVFLELNPNGQWLWLQLKSGYDLTELVAKNIIGNNEVSS